MRILAAVLFAFATTAASWAPAQDLPIRVGRIAHIEGQASLYQDPEAGWERAYINSPVTSENSVWTDVSAEGKSFGKHAGFCLEDQDLPDAVINPNFPSFIYVPDRDYIHRVDIEIA